jgi:hypothetical protein
MCTLRYPAHAHVHVYQYVYACVDVQCMCARMRIYIYIYIYIYIVVHVCAHAYTHTYIYVHIHIYSRVCMRACVFCSLDAVHLSTPCTCARACILVCAYMFFRCPARAYYVLYMCMYIGLRIHVFQVPLYVHVYWFAHTCFSGILHVRIMFCICPCILVCAYMFFRYPASAYYVLYAGSFDTACVHNAYIS